jgi:general secretion pathway protein D
MKMSPPAPHVRLRELNTSAEMQPGQTVLLSGPVSLELKRQKEKLPVLGDLPFLGRLFRSTSSRVVKTHMLLFLKLTEVDAKGEPVAPPEPKGKQ